MADVYVLSALLPSCLKLMKIMNKLYDNHAVDVVQVMLTLVFGDLYFRTITLTKTFKPLLSKEPLNSFYLMAPV